MPILENDLRTALASVRDPHTGQDFVTSQALTNLTIEGGDVAFDVVLGYPAQSLLTPLRQQLIAAARTVAGVQNVSANVRWEVRSHAVQPGVQLLPGVKNIIAVASGKGGVGKAPPAPTWPWRWRQKGRAWACSMPIFTAPASR